MSGRLTTHVLDLSIGKPAADVSVKLLRQNSDGSYDFVAEARTNEDGRLDRPLLEGDLMNPGVYMLEFEAGAYFEHRNPVNLVPVVFELIPIRFRIFERSNHYHVPLLLAPGGYSTYRGS
ncbi:5-hydroxyisourate hydrolase [Paenibacillus swuensis]|uniref:5-hydroxyisourate hydrolase n=1 Tax=Paenibacillus swuensis TaxID=1178515 RepID=A0A172TLG2_9BACL|nr:hydroxyisourate hydrolase [Paenibacillus swuensis]ANE47657.1 5-hydroxyisourate hydrolase [Paenibacillus swuensis]